ncbi:hypothetical protein WJ74_10915 [Burkholderia ubonensis]|uniref:hypothetical protein n=1 Tax=Burkholderia ubonensis TaxID=101571 RepID=UPI00076D7D28|nr:hypothetical protein [Burkholderia ubonensis]KVO15155.1 hypothetical protein WJ74_10915 [Burkholderia ubonensis]
MSEATMKEQAVDDSSAFGAVARAFLDGANLARCDVRDGIVTTKVIFGRERLDDGRPAISITAADARSMWRYAYNMLSLDGMSSHATFDPSIRQSSVLHRAVDGSDVVLTFESIPCNDGVIVLLGNRSIPPVFLEGLVREVEAEIVALQTERDDEWPEVDVLQVVGEQFSAGRGVVCLQPGMTDAMIVTAIKVAASHGMPFQVIPVKNAGATK